VPGSEGDDAFRTRVERAIGEIAANHLGETVAVVVHGGVINALLAGAFGTEPSWFALIENTSVTVVLAGAQRRILVVANDCSHLYDPVVQRPTP
jgi:probable phosphoglycerate mutase